MKAARVHVPSMLSLIIWEITGIILHTCSKVERGKAGFAVEVKNKEQLIPFVGRNKVEIRFLENEKMGRIFWVKELNIFPR